MDDRRAATPASSSTASSTASSTTTTAAAAAAASHSYPDPVPKATPDFKLAFNAAGTQVKTPLMVLQPGKKDSKLVYVVRLGGSKGKLAFSVSELDSGVSVSVVLDNPNNPKKATVTLKAAWSSKPVPNWRRRSEGNPAGAGSGPSPRTIKIPYAVLIEFDAFVNGVDITQGIQPDQALPKGPVATYKGVKLVKDKTTIVRVFAAVTKPQALALGPSTILVRAWKKNGTPLPGLVSQQVVLSLGAPGQVSTSTLGSESRRSASCCPRCGPRRARSRSKRKSCRQWSRSARGVAPECWWGPCKLNNRYRLESVPFLDTGFVNLHTTWGKIRGGAFPSLPTSQKAPMSPGAFIAAANQVLPLADGQLRGTTWKAKVDVTDALLGGILQAQFWGGKANLSAYLKPDTSHLDVEMVFVDDTPIPSPYGVFGVTSQHFFPGPAFPLPGKTVVNLRRPLTSVAHELGHALDLQHSDRYCGGDSNGEEAVSGWGDPMGYFQGIGYDIRSDKVLYDGNSSFVPPEKSIRRAGAWYDFMSYCADNGGERNAHGTSPYWKSWQPLDTWIGLKNWTKLRSHLVDIAALRKLQSHSRAAASVSTLEVRGVVNGAATALTRVGPGDNPPSSERASNYRLVLRDRGGAVMLEWPMVASKTDGHGGGNTYLSADVPLVPFLPGQLPVDLASVEVASGGPCSPEPYAARALRSRGFSHRE